MATRPLTVPALAALACSALLVPSCSSPESTPRSAGPRPQAPLVDPTSMITEIVDAHNRARASAGLPELVVNAELQAAAERQARDMAERRRMSHRGSDGSSPFRRMRDEGYQFGRAGENVAMGQPTVDWLMKDWMRSPGHRRNILGKFTELGAAGAIDKFGTPYWCVTFGDPERPVSASR